MRVELVAGMEETLLMYAEFGFNVLFSEQKVTITHRGWGGLIFGP